MINGRLKYRVGDVTVPESAGTRFIIHVVNNIGAYGAGVSGAIAKRWPKVEQEYRKWFWSQNNFKLGEIQCVQVQSDTIVVNMIGQDGIGLDKDGNPPGRYDAIEKCLEKVAKEAVNISDANICAPKFGAGLAGLEWDKIEPMIIDKLLKKGLNVTVYELKQD